jgi:hypothetical protein
MQTFVETAIIGFVTFSLVTIVVGAIIVALIKSLTHSA